MGDFVLNGFIFTSTFAGGRVLNEFMTTILQIIFTPTFLAICIIYSSLTFKIHFKHLKCCQKQFKLVILCITKFLEIKQGLNNHQFISQIPRFQFNQDQVWKSDAEDLSAFTCQWLWITFSYSACYSDCCCTIHKMLCWQCNANGKFPQMVNMCLSISIKPETSLSYSHSSNNDVKCSVPCHTCSSIRDLFGELHLIVKQKSYSKHLDIEK